jgi:hypothetical protein
MLGVAGIVGCRPLNTITPGREMASADSAAQRDSRIFIAMHFIPIIPRR